MEGIDGSLRIRVSSIVVKGNERTREAYFQNEFSESVRCRNIGELHQHLSTVTQHLQGSGLFEAVETNIKIGSSLAREVARSHNEGQQGGQSSGSTSYDITVDVTVKEVGIPQLKMESYIQTGSYSQDLFNFNTTITAATGV